MTDTNGDQIIEEAAAIVESETEPPMSLSEFVDLVLEEPQHACSSAEYLLRAIEHFGTRKITEHGDEYERWRFFDDPANNGEHAILGNTELLNDFVEDVSRIARGASNEEKMFWFEGPTATGKSELKRCLVNGLEAFSRTDEGKRFTIEWNLVGKQEQGDAMTYGEGPSVDQDWFDSPVQTNPLSVLPEEVRHDVLYDDADPSEWTPTDLDPFSAEAYRQLERDYDGQFENIVSDHHLRVKRYTMELGRGIGSIQSEDEGRPAHKLVGEWMHGMIERLDSRGRRNPQAMSYDGVLSQGNSGVSIIEDASYHFDMIKQMLSIPEDDEVKIDRRTVLPIDTVPIIISNPDMYSALMQTTQNVDDEFRPIRRRLDHYEIKYLVTPSIEAELLHRLIVGYEDVWEDGTDRMQQSVHVDDVELAPHALEAAAFYDVVSRFEAPHEMTATDKARIYDGEEIERNGDVYDIGYFREHSDGHEGRTGIPCTYTKDVVAEMVTRARNGEGIIMPNDLLVEMFDSLEDSPVFSDDEILMYSDDCDEVAEYMFEKQEEDVLSAILREYTVSEKEIEEYIEHVYCWGTDEDTVDPDPLKMKVFETEHLGKFNESHYGIDSDSGVSNEVESFREDEIIQGVSAYLYSESGDYDETADIPISQFPALKELIEEHTWEDVDRVFDDLEMDQWLDPPSNTQTEAVKEKTVQNMVEMFTYSDESARMTAEHVVRTNRIDEVISNVNERLAEEEEDEEEEDG